MTEYEFRIFRTDGSIAVVASRMQFDDSAAIRSAKIIGRGRNIEVWRGLVCIYRSALGEISFAY